MRCYDCCQENASNYGCDCGEYCVESSDWESHLCENCETPLCQVDVCYFCGKCIDCCGYESECNENMCVEEDGYNEHFCTECGYCFHSVTQCETCADADKLICKMCCINLASIAGCYCGDICINDDNFAEHMKTVHDVDIGVEVGGTITSYLSETDEIKVQLLEAVTYEIVDEITVKGKIANYSFDSVANGDYVIRVIKNNHVTREIDVIVDGENVATDVKINPKGDINGDGKIMVTDYSAILRHVKKVKNLEGYEFACADVNGDGRIMVTDYSAVLRHVKKTSSLW